MSPRAEYNPECAVVEEEMYEGFGLDARQPFGIPFVQLSNPGFGICDDVIAGKKIMQNRNEKFFFILFLSSLKYLMRRQEM
jgi:hypothetical protein